MPVASELLVKIGVRDDLTAGLAKADSQVSGFAKGAGMLGSVATAAFLGIGAAAVGLGAGIASSVGKAMEFESAIDGVGALVNATAAEIDILSAAALQLGQDTTLSGIGATDAAAAMAQLAAAGFSVAEMTDGATRGVLLLASATGTDVAAAAEIAGDSFNAFRQSMGLTAADMPGIANLFVGAANVSSIGLTDIGESMKYVGPIAASMGISIEDVTATIAALGNQGIKGSQAGTALRSVLASLAKPSKEAQKVINKLGLEFFDAGGNMKDFSGISGELKTKLAGLTDQQRASALVTLFGNEALSAATVMYGEGSEGIQQYIKDIAAQGDAAAIGAKRNDNLKGSVQALGGVWETAQITLGKAFIPALKDLVDWGARALSAAIPLIEAWGPKLVAGITSAIGVVRAFGGYIASAVGAIIGAWQKLQAGEITLAQFIGGVKTLVSTVLGDIGGLLSKAGDILGPFLAKIGEGILTALPIIGAELLKLGQKFGTWVTETAIPWVTERLPGWLSAIGTWITGTAVPAITTKATELATAFGSWISGAVTALTTNLPLWLAALGTWITGTAVPAVLTKVGELASAFGGWIGGAVTYLTTNIPLWLTALGTWITGTAVPTVTGLVVGIGNALGGWISGAITYLQEKIPEWLTALGTWITGTAVPTVVGLVVGIGNALGGWLSGAITYLQEKLPGWLDALSTWITGTVIPTVTGLVVGIGNALVGWIEGTAIPLVTEKMGLWTEAVTRSISEVSGPAIKISSDTTLPDALNSGVKVAAQDNRTHMQTWEESINERILTLPGKLAAWLLPASLELGQWIGKAIPGLVVNLAKYTMMISTFFMNLGPILAAATFKLIIPMWKWILDAIEPAYKAMIGFRNGLVTAVITFGSSIKTALDGIKTVLIAAAVAIGVGIVDGVISGILGGRGRVATASQSLAEGIPETVSKTLQEKSPSKVMMEIGRFAAEGLAIGLTEGEQTVAKAAAEVASAVAKAVTDVLGAMKALSGFDFANDSPTGDDMGFFAHLTTSLLATMETAAAQFEDKSLEHVGKFSDAVGKVGSSVKNAVDGLTALGRADWATSSPTGSAMGWFTHLISSLVKNFADAGAAFEEDGLASANAFAETVGKVAGVIKPATEGLASLADFAPPAEAGVSTFLTSLADLMEKFGTWAGRFETDSLAASSVYADAVGKVTSVLDTGTQGLAALATFVAPAEARVSAFLIALSDLMEKFGTWAGGFEVDGLAHANLFADAVGKVVSAANGGVTLFKAFDEKLIIPSAKKIDELLEGIKYVVGKFGEMASILNGEGLKQLTSFSDGAGKALAAAKTGTDLFSGMEKLVIPSKEAIDNLLGAIGYVIQRTREIAASIGTEGLTQAQAFATGALNVTQTIKTALELFPKLAEFQGLPTKALDAILGELGSAFGIAKSNVNMANDIHLESVTFLDLMKQAVANFAVGLAMGAGIPAGSGLGQALGAPPTLPSSPIPGLASGGLVTRPTLAFLAEREPEAVIPLSQMGRYGGGSSGGTTVNVTFAYHDHSPTADRSRLADFARQLQPELARLAPTLMGA